MWLACSIPLACHLTNMLGCFVFQSFHDCGGCFHCLEPKRAIEPDGPLIQSHWCASASASASCVYLEGRGAAEIPIAVLVGWGGWRVRMEGGGVVTRERGEESLQCSPSEKRARLNQPPAPPCWVGAV